MLAGPCGRNTLISEVMETSKAEQKNHPNNLHETRLIAMILSLLGGYLDAYTYVLRDGVFANAQTGNVVLLSLSIFTKNFNALGKYLFPILAFSLGILLSEYIKTIEILKKGTRRAKTILILESLIFMAIGFSSPYSTNLTITCTISFVAAIQVSTFNKIMNSNIATTMITGNLRSAMENMHRFLHYRDKIALENSINYLIIILIFALGASIGMTLSNMVKGNSIYFCLTLTGSAYITILFKEKTHS